MAKSTTFMELVVEEELCNTSIKSFVNIIMKHRLQMGKVTAMLSIKGKKLCNKTKKNLAKTVTNKSIINRWT